VYDERGIRRFSIKDARTESRLLGPRGDEDAAGGAAPEKRSQLLTAAAIGLLDCLLQSGADGILAAL
jgi:hypothetical protein